MQQMRGVNLGGWLVAERWITPELFDGVEHDGEIALVRELGRKKASQRLEEHRRSFITKKDFLWIQQHGFDVVRVPVGYWLFEETGDFVDGERYLKKAFRWAQEIGLKIILDFHGLQGSQNGMDHSGSAGPIRMYWPWNRRKALKTLEYMCKTYGTESALVGLEVINEPLDRWFLWRLMGYYDKAFAIASQYLPPECKIIVSDALKPRLTAKKLQGKHYSGRIVLDIHLYQAHYYDNDPAAATLGFDEHLENVRMEWKNLLHELSADFEILVGEWSAGLPARAYIDMPGGESAWVAEFLHTQRKLYEDYAWAECYWTYKAPQWGVWDYRSIAHLDK